MGRFSRRSIAAAVVQGVIVATLPAVALTVAAPQAAALPAGFTEQVVFSGLNQPMSVEFSDDGRVFVAEKSGLIKYFDGLNDTTPTTFADLRTRVHNQHDRGLMGLALAPTFPADPSVYVLYAHDAAIGGTAPRWGTPGATNDGCPNPPGETIDGCVISGRLSKLNATQPGGGAEQVLIEDWCQQFPSHSVGHLEFGPDGYLYATGGDGASYNYVDWGQAGNPVNPCGDPPGGPGTSLSVPSAEGGALRSQDVQTTGDPLGLDGTLIRVDPVTGAGAPGNPLAGSADANARRVVAAGMRNPFRFTFRPGTSEVWIGDVGWTQWEEINRVQAPADATVDNFGWPCREGTANTSYNNGLTLCQNIANGAVPTVSPHFAYRHGQPVVTGDGCATGSGSATSGVAFYEGGPYPDAYDGAMFFADYSRNCVWVMFPGADGLPDPATRQLFRQAGAYAVDLQIGPNGDLFYVDIATGQVKRIRYASGNQAPTASIRAIPSQGALPLTVTFDAVASGDPEGSSLAYAWDLDGDGQFDDGTGVEISRTYTVAGAVDVRVRATDPQGLSDVATTRVLAGTAPPTPVINSPAASFTWGVGDPIAFSGSATDPEDGVLPASALDWQALLHHCEDDGGCHVHPLVSFDDVASGQFEGPDHEYPSHVELRLTATDSTGVSATTSRMLYPRTGTVTLATSPAGLQVSVNDRTGAAPLSAEGIVGSANTISAPATQVLGGTTYTFVSWSDGGARVHNVSMATGTRTITATYRAQGGPPTQPGLVAAYSFDEGAGTTLTDRTGRGRTGTVAGATWSTSGRYGGALSFDGVNDMVTIADHDDLDLTTGMTLQAWVRPTVSNDWRTAILKERPSGLAYALYSAGFNQPSGYVHVGGDRSVTGPSLLPANAWSHLAMTYDGAAIRLYVGGTLVATQAQTGGATVSTGALRLGGNAVWGEWFSGLLDDVRIYNRALTAAEIATDRDTPVSPATPDTTAPSTPGGLTATNGFGNVTLTWTASTDDVAVTGYDVHRGTTSTFTPSAATLVAQVAGTTRVDTVAAGTHWYRVLARDAASNTSAPTAAVSGQSLADTTPPTVSITAPAAGATVSATVAVTATAADTGGSSLAGVTFRVDGTAIGAEDTVAPFTVDWSTFSVANGAHTLTAVARDTAGNTTTSAAAPVTVNNTAPPVDPALVAAYNFDEGTGTTLVDRSGKGNTGTVAGATWSTTGRNGGALSFDGVNDMVSIADANTLDFTTAFTIEAWVRPAAGASDWRTVVMKERPSGLAYALYSDNGASRPVAYSRNTTADNSATGSAPVAANTWTHLAVTYDGATLRLYVNGVLAATDAAPGALNVSTGALRLGGNSVWGEWYAGLMDDVRLYNRVLTPAQIVADMGVPA